MRYIWNELSVCVFCCCFCCCCCTAATAAIRFNQLLANWIKKYVLHFSKSKSAVCKNARKYLMQFISVRGVNAFLSIAAVPMGGKHRNWNFLLAFLFICVFFFLWVCIYKMRWMVVYTVENTHEWQGNTTVINSCNRQHCPEWARVRDRNVCMCVFYYYSRSCAFCETIVKIWKLCVHTNTHAHRFDIVTFSLCLPVK